MKILAVDDDPVILELLGIGLSAHGYTYVTFATSGENALEILLATEERFDCFIFDIQMPRLDGTEFCERVRKFPSYRTTPVIMITAMNQKKYFDMVFSAGATDYVAKPFDVTVLGARLHLAKYTGNMYASISPTQLAADTTVQQPYQATCTLYQTDGVISVQALRNMCAARNQSIEAIALAFPALERVHLHSNPGEYTTALNRIAKIITGIMHRGDMFTPYFGSGNFVCVGPLGHMPERQDIKIPLDSLLNQDSHVWCKGAQITLSTRVGYYCSVDIFTKIDVQELFAHTIKWLVPPQKGAIISEYGNLSLAEQQNKDVAAIPGNIVSLLEC